LSRDQRRVKALQFKIEIGRTVGSLGREERYRGCAGVKYPKFQEKRTHSSGRKEKEGKFRAEGGRIWGHKGKAKYNEDLCPGRLKKGGKLQKEGRAVAAFE